MNIVEISGLVFLMKSSSLAVGIIWVHWKDKWWWSVGRNWKFLQVVPLRLVGEVEVRWDRGKKIKLARGEEVKRQRGCDGEWLILGDIDDVKIDREVDNKLDAKSTGKWRGVPERLIGVWESLQLITRSVLDWRKKDDKWSGSNYCDKHCPDTHWSWWCFFLGIQTLFLSLLCH